MLFSARTRVSRWEKALATRSACEAERNSRRSSGNCPSSPDTAPLQKLVLRMQGLPDLQENRTPFSGKEL